MDTAQEEVICREFYSPLTLLAHTNVHTSESINHTKVYTNCVMSYVGTHMPRGIHVGKIASSLAEIANGRTKLANVVLSWY